MKCPSRCARRSRTFLSLLVCALAGSTQLSLGAKEVAADVKREPNAKVLFSPEAEEKFAQFLKKVAEAKRNRWELSMKKEIADVAKITGVGEEGRQALESAAKDAVAQCLEGWSAKFEEYFRKGYSRQPDRAAEMFDQMLPQADSYANAYYLGEHEEPTENALWAQGLQRNLTPAETSAWKKATEERNQTFEKSSAEFVKAQLERTREQHRTAMLARTADLKVTLALSKERAEEFETLAKEVADSMTDRLRERMKKTLFFMDEEQRRKTMKGGSLYLPTEDKDLPHQQPRWKEGVAKLLSAEELKQLEASRAERRSRRVRALGRMMVAEMDQQVAFTGSQRERLQPVTERLVQEQAMLFPEGGAEDYYNVSPQLFITAGAKATEAELKPVLDDAQWQRWREACASQVKKTKSAKPAGAKVVAEAKPPRRQPDAEEVEHGISDYLHERSLAEAKRVRVIMSLKAEDAARVAGLNGEVVNRLHTAARGAAEESLVGWKSTIEQNVRAQVGNATPQSVKQLVASMENFYYQRGGTIVDKSPVWENAVKSELTKEQQAAWQKEVDERNGYREKAMAAAILAEFDRRNLLTPAQWEKLEPMIGNFIKEYRPDIESMFSPMNSTPWYLQYYSMFIPFAGMPENDLKAILTKEQWERWTGSNEFGNTASYWENIQQNSARRAKKPK